MVKFMDRRHNMQTLEYVPEEKRERIARETLEVYAPLADRLGMGELKRELEDLSFRWVFPDEYEKIEDIMRENKLAKEPQLEKVAQKLKTALAEHGVKGFRTEARVKGYYSLYQKCKRKGGDIDKIHDLLAIRIILDSVEDCYRALGVVHTLWHPLPGKIKDYIAFHKPNGYRSIHTTVVTEAAGPVEIQLRTEAMHQEAQYGIASHLSYKEAGSMPDRGEQKKNKLWYAQLIPSLLKSTPKRVAKSVNSPKWMEDLAAAHKVEEEDEHGSTDSYLQAIREDFFTHRIFVFTPRGDVIDLPLDSTPIDFAYAIHSEIGERTSGAKVNGKLVSLTSQLHNGDIVEIETKDNARPTKKWLEHVRTSVAKKHITQTLAKMRKGEDVS
jgi:GTP pyrophosphokinase